MLTRSLCKQKDLMHMQVAVCNTPGQRTHLDSCPQCGDGRALELFLPGCTPHGIVDHVIAIAVALGIFALLLANALAT